MQVAEQVRGHARGTDAASLLRPGRDVEAIFEQARRRRKRRQRASAAAISVTLLAGASVWLSVGGGGGEGAVRGGDNDRPAATTAQSRSDAIARPAVRLAWIDSAGQLNIGDPANGTDHGGPVIDDSPTAPLVFAAGQLYWTDGNRKVAPIRDYDVATGKIRYLAPGEAVFTSADGRHLYIARNASTLLELPTDGLGRSAVLRAPAGWYMSGIGPGWVPTVAAPGVIVSSTHEPDYSVPRIARVGLWDPAKGQVRILGVGIGIFGLYTLPGARHSLIAWVPPSREIWQDNSFRITNTSTRATVTVRSPLHYGFVSSGAPAFSPGGTQMAVFVRTARLGSENGTSRLAIVSTSTGSVRIVPGTTLFTTEDAFWAMWLPGGKQILVGAVGSSYVVNTRTLTARPFSFFPSTDGFSATVLPGRR
jgi:hypothetical protein